MPIRRTMRNSIGGLAIAVIESVAEKKAASPTTIHTWSITRSTNVRTEPSGLRGRVRYITAPPVSGSPNQSQFQLGSPV